MKEGSAGVTPANHHANVNKRKASKDKLRAGPEQGEKHVMSKEPMVQGSNKDDEYKGEEGKNRKEREVGWNENFNIKLNHYEDEGRIEGEREGNVVDWEMKKG